MLMSLYIFVINACILFSWKENVFNFPSVKLVNFQNFYGVLFSKISCSAVGQSVHLLACDPSTLTFTFCNTRIVKCNKEALGLL